MGADTLFLKVFKHDVEVTKVFGSKHLLVGQSDWERKEEEKDEERREAYPVHLDQSAAQ